MKNKFKLLIIILVLTLCHFSVKSTEQFNFDVKEVEITDEGNTFKGLKGGTATTQEGLKISAQEFEYDKILNILIAKKNVKLEDIVNNYIIFADKITYFKNKEEIFTNGKTKAFIENKYEFESKDTKFYKNKKILISTQKSTITDDDGTFYKLDKFEYSLENKILKGDNIVVIVDYENSNDEEKDIYEFKDGIFNLENKDFIASDTKISVKKSIFDVSKNDPRIFGVSSNRKNEITTVNKGIFTSCALSDKCPPWSIRSQKIIHDKKKKQLIYDHSILKIYDVPVMYFPKFFHPDPTVKRQSGFLQPQLNNSTILGTSLLAPYYHVISKNSDMTIKPTIFDSDIYMFSNEYRRVNKNSNFIIDLGLTKGYQSSSKDNNKNSIGHLFSKFELDLDLKSFENSDLEISLEKVTNDTYLKVFDTNLINTDKEIRPSNVNQLTSSVILNLDNENINFNSGVTAYEKLKGLSSDRYEYVLPYYNLSMTNFYENEYGNFNFSSNGNNNLRKTNNLRSVVNNSLNFETFDFISKKGFKNNFGVYFKNINTTAKNDEQYKSSPQVELSNIYNFETSLPLTKLSAKSFNTLTPRLSFRINPGDMKDYSNENKFINTDNIFGINRLGLSDNYEQGKSLTLGLDYSKEKLDDVNTFFEFNIAKVLRDVRQDNIPISSSIGQKSSNIFGSSTIGISNYLNLNYDFSIDNDLNTFEQNSIGAELSLFNLITEFNYLENAGKMGGGNVLENKTTLSLKDKNFLTFQTRRNREINLTEYYDLVYEYKNDCLTAGFKYKKTYYQDRDVQPKEDLLFTITLFPLTQYEQKVDQSLYRD